MLETSLTHEGLDDIIQWKRVPKDFLRQQASFVPKDLKTFFLDRLASLTDRHTIKGVAVSTKGQGFNITVTYTEPDLEKQLETETKEQKKLEDQIRHLEKRIKDIEKRIASKYRSAAQKKSEIEKLQKRHNQLTKSLKERKYLAQDVGTAIKGIQSSLSFVEAGLGEASKTLLSLQDQITVLAEKVVRDEPIPVRAKDGTIAIRRLSLNTILKSKEIPDYVRSRYLTNYILKEYFDEYPTQVLEKLTELMAA